MGAAGFRALGQPLPHHEENDEEDGGKKESLVADFSGGVGSWHKCEMSRNRGEARAAALRLPPPGGAWVSGRQRPLFGGEGEAVYVGFGLEWVEGAAENIVGWVVFGEKISPLDVRIFSGHFTHACVSLGG